MNRWVNFLSLLPGTLLTLLIISIAFLRFYDETDFTLLGYVANARTWSNRCTVAALVVALVGFCTEWDRRNREAARIANERAEAREQREEEARRREEEARRREEDAARAANERAEERKRREEDAARAANERAEERQRSLEERERAARRARIQNRWIVLQARYLLNPSTEVEAAIADFVQFLQEYGEL